MPLPSFDDFLASRAPESEDAWDLLSGQYNLLTTEGLTEFLARVYAQSQIRMLALLREYHEWISQELGRQ